MTWTSFGLWLSLGYLAYYGLNLAFDMLLSGKSAAGTPAQQELFFEEASEPELIDYLEDAPVGDLPVLGASNAGSSVVLGSGRVSGSGALSIAELLIRAKDELIEHTRAIPY